MRLSPSSLLLTTQLLGGCRHRADSDSLESADSGSSRFESTIETVQDRVGGMGLVSAECMTGFFPQQRLAWHPEADETLLDLRVMLVTPEESLVPDLGRLKDQIERALETWNAFDPLSTSTPLSFDSHFDTISADQVEQIHSEYPQAIFIYVDSDLSGKGSVASTLLLYEFNCSSGFANLTDASIVVHAWTIENFGENDDSMVYIFTHELGHVWGLKHSTTDDPDVLMSPNVDLDSEELSSSPRPNHEGVWLNCVYTPEEAEFNSCLARDETEDTTKKTAINDPNQEANTWFSGDLLVEPRSD